jgi:hypothetical protein
MHHSIDFHAATVAGDDKWRMIQSMDSIRFEWVANYRIRRCAEGRHWAHPGAVANRARYPYD